MKKGAKWMENQGECFYKCFKKYHITYFGENIDQFLLQLSLELNVIETILSCRKRGQ